MTLQELRFIIALAQEKHFGKAAQVVHVSQPTLSIAIRKLEAELGMTLFERNKNDVRITPLGKEIVERAKRVIEEVDEIKQVALTDRDQLSAPFRLGAIYTVGPYLLPPLITALHKLAPQMSLEIQEDFTVNLKKKLCSGDLDAIVISLPFDVPGIVTHVIYKEPFVVVLPNDHSLVHRKSINENELSRFNVLLLGDGHCFRDQVVSSCPNCFIAKKANFGVNWRTVEGSSLETIRHMVAAKMGLTILPATAASVSPYRENLLTTRPLKGNSPYRSIAFAWRNSFPRIKAIDMLLKAASRCNIAGASK